MPSTLKNVVPVRWQTTFTEITTRHGSVIASLLAGVASGQLETTWGPAQLLISGATLLGFATYEQFQEWAEDKTRESLEQDLLQRIQMLTQATQDVSQQQSRQGQRQAVHLQNIQLRLLDVLQKLDEQARSESRSFETLLAQFLQTPTVADDSFWGGLQREVDWARDDINDLCRMLEAGQSDLRLAIQEAQQRTVTQLTNPGLLAERIRGEIASTAKQMIANLPQAPGRWQRVAEIENERDAQLGRVNELIRMIQRTIESGASADYQQAVEIWQTEGADAALAYLESRRASALEHAQRHARQAEAAAAHAEAEKIERNKSLQQFVLEAELLEAQLQWEPALKLREQVATLAPDWFDARNQLGLLLFNLARFGEAEPHLRAVVVLGDHTEREAVALNNLAALLQATNRLAEAEPLMRRALAIDEQSFGTDHPNVARDLNNLAALLRATNRLAEAEPLMRRAVDIFVASLGSEHPSAQTVAENYRRLLADI